VLSHFGIDVRGRSHRLKLNYRTTEQVLRWAVRLVTRQAVDDLDGSSDSTIGYRSLYGGPAPEEHRVTSAADETAFLVARVRQLEAETAAEEIAVVARTRGRVNGYARALADAGLTCTVLDGDGATTAGVQVATMHRVKGLEFTHVIMHMPASTVGAAAAGARDPREAALLSTSPRRDVGRR
jgi:superfamily I DNA/RNA helicase